MWKFRAPLHVSATHLAFQHHTLTCKRPVIKKKKRKNYRNDTVLPLSCFLCPVCSCQQRLRDPGSQEVRWQALTHGLSSVFVLQFLTEYVCVPSCSPGLWVLSEPSILCNKTLFCQRQKRRWHKVGGLFSAQGSVLRPGALRVYKQGADSEMTQTLPVLTSNLEVLLSSNTNRENSHLTPD